MYIYNNLFIRVRCLLLCVFISVSILLLLWSSWWINRLDAPQDFRAVHCCQAITPPKKEKHIVGKTKQKIHTHTQTRMPQTQKKSTTGTTPPTRPKKKTTKLSEAFGDIISDPVVDWLHRGTPMVWICAASQQGYSDVTPRVLAAFFDDSEGLGKYGAALRIGCILRIEMTCSHWINHHVPAFTHYSLLNQESPQGRSHKRCNLPLICLSYQFFFHCYGSSWETSII